MLVKAGRSRCVVTIPVEGFPPRELTAVAILFDTKMLCAGVSRLKASASA